MDKLWCGALGSLAEGLAFLRAVDAAEADVVSPGIVQGFDS